jgi:hypothetical protein
MPDLPNRIEEIYASIGEPRTLIDVEPEPEWIDRAGQVLAAREGDG